MHDDPFARAVERVQAAEKAEEADKRRRRKARLSEGSRKGFRIHATIYVAVNLFLFAIWLSVWQLNDGTSYPWFIWPLLGWGVGLAAHYSAARDHLTQPAKRPEGAAAKSEDDTAAARQSTTDELSRLAQLHRAGDLSDDEFSAAKSKLLG